jgi:3D (Asp-Asp-Asp) domain-containing protein
MDYLLIALLAFNVYSQEVVVTAYTAAADECGKSDGITASGYKATEGVMIAADHLPYGTMVEIDGHMYIVTDRFGGGYDNKIDIFMQDKDRAFQFGRQIKKVKIHQLGRAKPMITHGDMFRNVINKRELKI